MSGITAIGGHATAGRIAVTGSGDTKTAWSSKGETFATSGERRSGDRLEVSEVTGD
ncbi:hypothetical protein BHE90_017689, partial [Fusarium euwallaceae]